VNCLALDDVCTGKVRAEQRSAAFAERLNEVKGKKDALKGRIREKPSGRIEDFVDEATFVGLHICERLRDKNADYIGARTAYLRDCTAETTLYQDALAILEQLVSDLYNALLTCLGDVFGCGGEKRAAQ